MAHWLQHSKLAPRFDFNTEGDLKNIALVVPFHPFFPGNIRYGINYLFLSNHLKSALLGLI